MKSVTVYCSSSKRVDPYFLDQARQLGAAIAKKGWTLVYGGNNLGCMGQLADGARKQGGQVVGVCPKIFSDKGFVDELCDELILTEDMSQRKKILMDRADAFIVFPGGIGTLDELIQALTEKHIGAHGKKIVLVNLSGFFDSFIAMMKEQVAGGFTKERIFGEMIVAQSVQEAVEKVV